MFKENWEQELITVEKRLFYTVMLILIFIIYFSINVDFLRELIWFRILLFEKDN